MTQLQRLLFLQGNACFFCREKLTLGEASVEHLVARANGGTDEPGNLVVCCDVLNKVFGSMSVKDKLAAVLDQNGRFVCPKRQFPAPPQQAKPTPRGATKPSKKPVNPAPVPTLAAAKPVASDASNGTPTPLGGDRGKPWTDAEDRTLLAHFDASFEIGELAKMHQRGAGGVISRLVKLGRKPVTQRQIADAAAGSLEAPPRTADAVPP